MHLCLTVEFITSGLHFFAALSVCFSTQFYSIGPPLPPHLFFEP